MTVYVNPPHGNDETGLVNSRVFPFKTHAAAHAAVAALQEAARAAAAAAPDPAAAAAAAISAAFTTVETHKVPPLSEVP